MVAVCVLVLSVFFGPAVLGATAFADADCHVSCCDEAPSQATRFAKSTPAEPDTCCPNAVAFKQVSAASPSSLSSEHTEDSKDPASEQGCPEDCPGCDLGLSFALAMSPSLLANGVPLTSETCVVAPREMPASGTCASIYRPPRSLS